MPDDDIWLFQEIMSTTLRTLNSRGAVFFLTVVLSSTGCTPHVIVEAPDKPIEININAKISHEVKIKVEKDVEDLVKQTDKKLF